MGNSAHCDTLPTRWTRHQVAEHLGVSVATVRRMEGHALHPEISDQGVRLFDVTEVRVVRAERAERPASTRDKAGEIAARMFELFEGGTDLRKVVISARVHPRVVRELYAEWLVSLVEGENRRRVALINAEDRRERARMERDHRHWERALKVP